MSEKPFKKEGPQKVVAADGHVYHKSATANATEAPTNEATTKNAVGAKAATLSPDDLDFVTLVNYHYGLDGALPSAEFLASNYDWSQEEIAGLYDNPLIVSALEERGVIVAPKQLEAVGVPFDKPKRVLPLTPLQLVAANTMLDLADSRSERKKLQDLGITTRQYQAWLRDPDFSRYLRERTESMIGDVQHEAMLSLIDSVRAGNMKAIQYYHELTGRFVPTSGRETGNGTTHDLQQIVVRIIEIIIDEVEDPAVAGRISDRLRGLVIGNQVAGVIPTEAIVAPEIAVAREQTPEVQELMNRGVGYDS